MIWRIGSFIGRHQKLPRLKLRKQVLLEKKISKNNNKTGVSDYLKMSFKSIITQAGDVTLWQSALLQYARPWV